MSTIIYPSPIFGPIHSRRLGVSLGINLLPEDGKVCTFDCLYCECGFNAARKAHKPLPTREEVAAALEEKLIAMKAEGVAPIIVCLQLKMSLFRVEHLRIEEDTASCRLYFF